MKTSAAVGFVCALLAWLPAAPVLAASAGPTIRDNRLVLPRRGISDVEYAYHFTFAPRDLNQVHPVLRLAEAGTVLRSVSDSGDVACGPKVSISWKSGESIQLQLDVDSDTLSLAIFGRADSITRGWLTAPGLADTLKSIFGWQPLVIRSMGRIDSAEVITWQERPVFFRDRQDLDSLELVLSDMGDDCPTGCPFWNRVRLQTERGCLYGLLTADGDNVAILARSSAMIDSAWGADPRTYEGLLRSLGTTCWIRGSAYSFIQRQAERQGASLIFRSEDR